MTPKPPTPTLESERFTLRELQREDAPALLPTLSDEEQCLYMLRGPFESLVELEGWLFDSEWTGRSWGAVDRATGALTARLVVMPGDKHIAEIGYITVQEWQGKGVATECTARLIAYLFEEERLHRITAGTDPGNDASNALLTRHGFRREAHMIESVHTHRGWCDEYFWGLLASEWERPAT